jgi:hypothetical protein
MTHIENTASDFQVGQRVQLHPATDLWMRGARYGTVVFISRSGLLTVSVDALNRNIRIHPRNLLPVAHD